METERQYQTNYDNAFAYYQDAEGEAAAPASNVKFLAIVLCATVAAVAAAILLSVVA